MERRVIVSASLAHAATHSLELTFAALLFRIGLEFGVDLAVLGVVANIGAFTFGATALPSGYLTDRYGARAVIAAGFGAAAVCAGLVALSPSLPLFALSLALLGASIGLYHPAGVAMVSTVGRRRGLAFAAHGVAGNLGVALAPAVGTGIAIAFGWRASYVALALMAVVVALLVMRIAPTRAEVAEAASRAAREQAAPAAEQDAALPRSAPPRERRWLSPPLLLIFFCAVGMGFIYRGALTFLAIHLRDNLEIDVFGWSAEGVAGAAAALVLLTAVVGQVIGGMLSDRMPIERAALPMFLLNPLMLALVAPAHGVALLLAAMGFVITNFAQQPVINGLIADYAPAGAAGRAYGVSFFMTFALGSFAGTAAGLIASRSGTVPMFYMLAVVAVALAVAVVVVAAGAERRRREMLAARAAEAAAGG